MSPPNIPVAALIGIDAGRLGTLFASRTDASALLPQVMPGQMLSARVDAVLPDGNFRVTVAGQPMSMALPKYLAPGDTLELVFVAREPRLTFALSEGQQSSPAAPVVSRAGRLLESLLPRPGTAAMPAAVADAAPLLAAAPTAAGDGATLATKLQGTVTQSGLFYESHQAEWVSGRRDLATLLREPQASLESQPRAESQTRIEGQTRAEGQTRVDIQTRTNPAQQQPAPPLAMSSNAPGTPEGTVLTNDRASTSNAIRGDQPMPQQAQALVQQQLAALETGKLVFQLQVWPEQWMRWEIDEEAQHPGAQTGESDAQQRFQTRLHLDLPKLGGLDATLTFDAAGVRVRLDAAKEASANLLQDNRASLRAALADAGISAADIAVARHGSA